MEIVRDQLIQTRDYLQKKCKSPKEVIERLRAKGSNVEEIEIELLELNKLQGAFDSVETALKILEG